jgi:hypothetical protein
MKLEFSRKMLKKSSNTKFHENLFSASRDVACGRTDMTTLGVALRSFANAPKPHLALLGSIGGYLGGVSENVTPCGVVHLLMYETILLLPSYAQNGHSP